MANMHHFLLTTIFSRLVPILSVCFFVIFSLSGHAQSGRDDQLKDLVKMNATILQASGKKYLAVTLKVANGWHIYWKNPGDAGLPPRFSWIKYGLNIPMTALEWPAPKKYVEKGDILSFGYSDTTHFFFRFSKQAQKGFPRSKITLQGKWLVCSHICIPDKESLTLTFNEDLTQVTPSPRHYSTSQTDLLKALQKLPQLIDLPQGLDLYLLQDAHRNLFLYFSMERKLLRSGHYRDNILFPFPNPLIDFKREQLFEDKQEKIFGRISLDWVGEYLGPPQTLPKNGHFSSPLSLQFLFFHTASEKKQVIRHTFSHFTQDKQNNVERFYQNLDPFPPKHLHGEKEGENIQTTENPLSSLLYYLLLAFIGGIILNFMPCVLPVISLKLFSLIKYKQATRRELFKHNLSYTIGVLISFLALGVTVVLLRASGESIGWGFQLQSPLFVATMIVAILIFTCNLFGLFELRTLGGIWVNKISLKEGLWGDFSSGVLATILSTPCSAPLLGTALTFAFSSSALFVFLTFFSLGLGLSSPFLMTALFPSTLALIPRPGKWMDDLKKFLGLTLLLTIVWLYDIFLFLVEQNDSVLILNLTLTTLFFALYFHHRMGQKMWIKIILYLTPVALFISLLSGDLSTVPNRAKTSFASDNQKKQADLNWMPWSEQAMEELKGELVFIDFTARWCFTCKVNEKLVLKTSGFKQLVQSKGVKLLLADWTKRDPVIANFLRRHGHVGVPVYFVQKRNGKLISLGETITLREIEAALRK